MRRAVLRHDPGMQADIRDLRRLREKTAMARAEALRLGNRVLASLLAKAMAGIDLKIEEVEENYTRTRPQIEALKRLVGAT